ncbi:MAG: DUF885 domain-containing protein [Lachnospiraceae bacterium]|jgi:uncharacterized protein (DUF885 family)|nr:DUF885 domain-containing protein [Lachnospiraceae bacterium]
MYRKNIHLIRISALTLSASFLLFGCTRNTPPPETETERIPTADFAAEEQFQEMINNLFYDTVTSSGLTMHSMLTDPEAYGITEYPETLGDYSIQALQDNYAELRDDYEKLLSIDRSALSPELQTDYDILLEYMETEQEGEKFLLYDHPFSAISGVQVELPIVLAEYSFRTPEDAEHYLALLSSIDEYYDQLLKYVQAQKEAGIFLSDQTISDVLDSCQSYLDAPETGMMAETFLSRLDSLTELSQEDREALISRNEEILKNDFTAAYVTLTEGLEDMKGHAESPSGASSLPNGTEYYEYLLKSSTYTSYRNPKALKDAIAGRMLDELDHAQELMSQDPELIYDLYQFDFSIQDPEDALTDLQTKLLTDFPEVPAYAYEVRTLPEALEPYTSPAFYLSPPIDTQNENFIYINQSSVAARNDIYTVMAHEGYPGHLYQCNYFNTVNHSLLRSLMSFSCYVEGWATYVQYLAYQWDDQIRPELAELLAINESAYLALYALVDYQVNYEGMTVEELGEFLNELFRISNPEAADSLYQIVCEDPANYMKYYVGYLEISEMREKAEEVLGNDFDAKAFHTFLLDFGPAPFSLIWEHFDEWLLSQK